MACTLRNKCAKNLSKRTMLLQLIIKNVVTCFFLEHSVYTDLPVNQCYNIQKSKYTGQYNTIASSIIDIHAISLKRKLQKQEA